MIQMRKEGGLRTKGIIKESSSDSPLISIITPTLNRRETLVSTMESVFNQTYPLIEYIIIDGGSTDGTVEMLEEWDEKIDYWVSEKDRGIFDAMNKGIDLARGELIGIINSDDWYAPTTVEKVVNAWKEDPEADVFFGDALVILRDIDFAFLRKGNWRKLPQEMSINHPTCFLTRRAYEKWGKFDISFPYAADYELALRLYTNGAKFHYIPGILAYQRKGGVSEGYGVHLDVFRIYLKYFSFSYALLKLIQHTSEHLMDVTRQKIGKLLKLLAGKRNWEKIREKWLRRKFGKRIVPFTEY